jgi:NhaA family Na+:H+ antiporter
VANKNKKLSTKTILDFVLHEERRSSVILILAALCALIIANSNLANFYYGFFNYEFSIFFVNLDIKHWINEGLMAFFFLVVGIEIKRELINGELRSWKKASFPVIAAIGGMIVPALIFSAINPSPPQSYGWAIPMATDIAVAVGVIGLLGSRIPKSLRVFLLTLAIVDDIGSIIVINVFYNQPTNMLSLVFAIILIICLFIIRKQKRWFFSFIILSFLLWYCLLMAGVSATIAGVIIALAMPLKSSKHKNSKVQQSELIENALVPFTAFFIVPLFVFANAGISFSAVNLNENGSITVFAGVLLGLAVGKPIGVFGACWLGNLLRISQMPSNISWSQLLGVGFISGIGFTISLLIAGLSYDNNVALQNAATIGIFTATIISGVVGLSILYFSKRNNLRNS